MFYKLYKEVSKNDSPAGINAFSEFKKIYEDNNVRVIGLWRNADNQKEYFFMTQYNDVDHYMEFVSKMKDNETYQTLSKAISRERVSLESYTLESII